MHLSVVSQSDTDGKRSRIVDGKILVWCPNDQIEAYDLNLQFDAHLSRVFSGEGIVDLVEISGRNVVAATQGYLAVWSYGAYL